MTANRSIALPAGGSNVFSSSTVVAAGPSLRSSVKRVLEGAGPYFKNFPG